uniref:MYND-type domain-containing protein n=1 Tax=Mycena chlorophos TaxID=658473 RepID=A0ABQ0LWT7_MYCCL|nr:predicted protein [Mycena chlorophos]
MHESLRLSNLGKLPFRLKVPLMLTCLSTFSTVYTQVLAERTLRGTQTEADMAALLHAAELGTPREQRLVAPLFFATLDTIEIGVPLEEDALLKLFTRAKLGRLSYGFRGISTTIVAIDAGALGDVWSRCWTWMQFLDKHKVYIASDFRDEFPLWFLSLVRLILQRFADGVQDDGGIVRAIEQTPRLRVLLAQTWAQLIRQDPSNETRRTQIAGLIALLMLPGYGATFDEMVEGAGGRAVLADIIVAHIKHEWPSMQGIPNDPGLHQRIGILMLMSKAVRVMPDELRRKGLVPALTTACVALSAAPPSLLAPPAILDGAVNSLFRCFDSPRPQRYIGQSIKAGLFHLFFLSARWEAAHSTMRDLFDNVLPPLLSLYPVTKELYAIELLGNENPKDYLKPASIEVWNEFKRKARWRYAIFQRFKKANNAARLVGCSNLACEKIVYRHLVKRCAGCEVRLYCSKQCQRADWREGGHRDSCRSQANPSPYDILHHPMDREFLIGVLNAEYERQREYIAGVILRLTMVVTKDPMIEFWIRWTYNSKAELGFTCGLLAGKRADTPAQYSAFYDSSPAMRRAFAAGRAFLSVLQLDIPTRNLERSAGDESSQFPEDPLRIAFKDRPYAFVLRSSTGAGISALRRICRRVLENGQDHRHIAEYSAEYSAELKAASKIKGELEAHSGKWLF